MKYTRALIASIKYNVAALLPTLLGVGLIAAGGWFGVVDPVLDVMLDAEPEELLDPGIVAEIAFSPTLAGGGLLAGYFVHRVGRTALMFKIHGDAVQAAIEEAQSQSQTSDDPSPATNDGSGDDDAGSEDDTGTEDDAEEDVDEDDGQMDTAPEDDEDDDDGWVYADSGGSTTE